MLPFLDLRDKSDRIVREEILFIRDFKVMFKTRTAVFYLV